jgi:hypothetical protein
MATAICIPQAPGRYQPCFKRCHTSCCRGTHQHPLPGQHPGPQQTERLNKQPATPCRAASPARATTSMPKRSQGLRSPLGVPAPDSVGQSPGPKSPKPVTPKAQATSPRAGANYPARACLTRFSQHHCAWQRAHNPLPLHITTPLPYCPVRGSPAHKPFNQQPHLETLPSPTDSLAHHRAKQLPTTNPHGHGHH